MNASIVGSPGAGYNFKDKAEWARKKSLEAYRKGNNSEGKKFDDIASAYQARCNAGGK